MNSYIKLKTNWKDEKHVGISTFETDALPVEYIDELGKAIGTSDLEVIIHSLAPRKSKGDNYLICDFPITM